MNGVIYAVESMGLVDGPGIRYVVFFQGCSLRCKFCHNPDSQSFSGKEISSEELIEKIKRFIPYFNKSGGGVTFSGGEPLMQPEFLLEMLRKCKDNNIHTCLDTAGVGIGMYDEILNLCDLVLYDIKAIDNSSYSFICGKNISETERFQKALVKSGVKTVVRQVVIPGINDNDEYMQKLSEYIKVNLPGTTDVELLPYHLMGEHKYKKMNIPMPLEGIPAMDKEKTQRLWEKYFKNLGV